MTAYVVAVNSWGESDPSTSQTLVILYFTPDAPTALVFDSISETNVTLSWTAPLDNGGLDITGYLI